MSKHLELSMKKPRKISSASEYLCIHDTTGVGVRREVASAQPLDSRAFYRVVWPTGLGAHILCALDLPPSSLMAVLSCISFNTKRQNNIGLSFKSLSVGRESRHDRDVVTEFGAPWMGDTKP